MIYVYFCIIGKIIFYTNQILYMTIYSTVYVKLMHKY